MICCDMNWLIFLEKSAGGFNIEILYNISKQFILFVYFKHYNFGTMCSNQKFGSYVIAYFRKMVIKKNSDEGFYIKPHLIF